MAAMTGHASSAFETAGPGAALDTWKVAPPFGAMITTSRLLGFLHPSRRGVPTMIAMGAALPLVVTVLLL
jgi:hypothetical protein